MPYSGLGPHCTSSSRGLLARRRSRSLCRLSSRSRRQGPWISSEDLVCEVPLPEHALLPALDVRDGVWEDFEGVVRRDDGHTEHVAQGDEHEEMLQVHAGAKRRRDVAVGGHAVEDALRSVLDPPSAGFRCRRFLRFGHWASLLLLGMRRGLNSLTFRADYFSRVPPSAAVGARARASVMLLR